MKKLCMALLLATGCFAPAYTQEPCEENCEQSESERASSTKVIKKCLLVKGKITACNDICTSKVKSLDEIIQTLITRSNDLLTLIQCHEAVLETLADIHNENVPCDSNAVTPLPNL